METDGPQLWLRRQLEAAMQRPSQPLSGHPSTQVRFIPVVDGDVRVIHVPREEGAPARRPLVFIPGFGSTLEGWQEAYDVVVGISDLYIIETLEKTSARVRSPIPDLSVRGMAWQIAKAIEALGLGDDYVLFGSCWGASVVLEGMLAEVLNPPVVGVYDPMHNMWFPPWFLRYVSPFLPIPLVDRLRHPIKRVAIRGMREEWQRARIDSFIRSADAALWKRAAEQSWDFELMGRLGALQREVWVFNGSHDKVHDKSLYPRVAAEMPQGRFFHLEVHERHREWLAGIIARELTVVGEGDGAPPTLVPFEAPLRRG